MDRACDVLLEAEALREVMFSYIDAGAALALGDRNAEASSETTALSAMLPLVRPLHKLHDIYITGCRFKVGDVQPASERQAFMYAVRGALQDCDGQWAL